MSHGLDRLTISTNALASTVIAHDAQIEALIKVSESHHVRLALMEKGISDLTEQITRTERQWQAYINTLPRH